MLHTLTYTSKIESEDRLITKVYEKRDDFHFPILNFPFTCSNIPAAPAFGAYIFPMIRYSRACGSYQDFLDRGFLLTRMLLNQGFLLVKSSLRKFYGRQQTWLTVMEYHKWRRICSTCRKHFPVWVSPSFQWVTCYSIFKFYMYVLQIVFCTFKLFFWSLRGLFFFDIRILIGPLVSSNSSNDNGSLPFYVVCFPI